MYNFYFYVMHIHIYTNTGIQILIKELTIKADEEMWSGFVKNGLVS